MYDCKVQIIGEKKFQIAKARGLRTISIVRKRDNFDEVANELKSLGADEIYTEEEMLRETRGKVMLMWLVLWWYQLRPFMSRDCISC